MEKNIISLKSWVKNTYNETFPYSKKIKRLSSIFIDARQTNILNFSILNVPKLRCRTNCFKTHLNVFSSLEGSLRLRPFLPILCSSLICSP